MGIKYKLWLHLNTLENPGNLRILLIISINKIRRINREWCKCKSTHILLQALEIKKIVCRVCMHTMHVHSVRQRVCMQSIHTLWCACRVCMHTVLLLDLSELKHTILDLSISNQFIVWIMNEKSESSIWINAIIKVILNAHKSIIRHWD